MWLKLSDDFGVECDGLSDSAFRTHVEGLLWTMHCLTDGHIPAANVRRFAASPGFEAAIEELVALGWWSIVSDGFMIRHAMGDQVESEVVHKRRENDAARQRKSRRKKAGLEPDPLDASRPDPSRPDQGHALGHVVSHASRPPVTGDDPKYWMTAAEVTAAREQSAG